MRRIDFLGEYSLEAYERSSEPAQVLPRLWLGDARAAKPASVNRLGFDAVLNLAPEETRRRDGSSYTARDVEYLSIEATDRPDSTCSDNTSRRPRISSSASEPRANRRPRRRAQARWSTVSRVSTARQRSSPFSSQAAMVVASPRPPRARATTHRSHEPLVPAPAHPDGRSRRAAARRGDRGAPRNWRAQTTPRLRAAFLGQLTVGWAPGRPRCYPGRPRTGRYYIPPQHVTVDVEQVQPSQPAPTCRPRRALRPCGCGCCDRMRRRRPGLAASADRRRRQRARQDRLALDERRARRPPARRRGEPRRPLVVFDHGLECDALECGRRCLVRGPSRPRTTPSWQQRGGSWRTEARTASRRCGAARPLDARVVVATEARAPVRARNQSSSRCSRRGSCLVAPPVPPDIDGAAAAARAEAAAARDDVDDWSAGVRLAPAQRRRRSPRPASASSATRSGRA